MPTPGAGSGGPPPHRALLQFPIPQARPGRTRRNLPADEWRARILHVARVLFAEHGYDGVTMEEIARSASISRARLYRLFPGRREVFEAIITQDAQTLAGELLLELGAAVDAAAKVRALVEVFFRFVEARQERHRILYSHAGQADPALAEMMRTVRGALAEALSQQLGPLRADAAERSPAELRLMAHGIISMAEGAATAWASGPRVERERSVDLITDIGLRALLIPHGDSGL
jgi:AcrR family transcriptional regulator